MELGRVPSSAEIHRVKKGIVDRPGPQKPLINNPRVEQFNVCGLALTNFLYLLLLLSHKNITTQSFIFLILRCKNHVFKHFLIPTLYELYKDRSNSTLSDLSNPSNK